MNVLYTQIFIFCVYKYAADGVDVRENFIHVSFKRNIEEDV